MSSTSGIMSSISGMEHPDSRVMFSAISFATAASRANRSRCYSITILSSSRNLTFLAAETPVSCVMQVHVAKQTEHDTSRTRMSARSHLKKLTHHHCPSRGARHVFNDRHKTLNNRVIILLELAIFASTSSPLIQLISVLRRDQSDLLERLHVGGRGYP